LADDPELLNALAAANFFAVFVGIESPDTNTLISMRKKQDTQRNLQGSIYKIYNAGIFVFAGFIVGFDSERGNIAPGMIDCIEEYRDPGMHGRAVVRTAGDAIGASVVARRTAFPRL
jgi:hypothetical protein